LEHCDLRFCGVDHDHPLTRAAVDSRVGLSSCILGDLRTVPLPPRSFDIVHCALLLERIQHVELVLDRFVAALKPGGLLLLRTHDRDTAAGYLDRILPDALRGFLWRRLHPGQPGPFPVVYERLVSARGVQWYALMRGLVVAERREFRQPPGHRDRWARLATLARGVVASVTRGRLTDAHDELAFVIRKPENRFARVL
jgi:SAM-dependent methyltransferase